MVRQGDVIFVNFSPQSGHEQAGRRPALVVSNNTFNEKTGMTIVCPITTTDNGFPLHVPLEGCEKVQGVVMCEHVKALDIAARGYEVVDRVSENFLARIVRLVSLEIQIE